jgi:hypothetical protein
LRESTPARHHCAEDHSARRHPAGRTPTPKSTHATVFGLDVFANGELSFLEGTNAARTGRRLELSLGGLLAPVPDTLPGAELVCDQREPDGGIAFRIEAHAHAGYRIWGPGRGTHLLCGEGRLLRSFAGDNADGRPDGGLAERSAEGTNSSSTDRSGWQRLLVAQALPFAATLQGLEVFHAGAVLLDSAAIGFAGASGAGKSSTVVELCDRGAGFVTDDVLALERVDGELLTHPGAPLASLAQGAERRCSDRAKATLAMDGHELIVSMPSAERALPLRALFFLDRQPDGPARPRFEPVVDARMLLSATFNFVLSSPARLQRLLDVCALIARRRVERISFGPLADPSVVATAVEERLSGGA